MLVWNWIAAWLLLIFALVEYGPSAFGKRCPRCGNSMQAYGRLELLTQYADRYWGWRTFQCTHCLFQQTRLSASCDPRMVVYQTHIVR
jgi:hypothetical protein